MSPGVDHLLSRLVKRRRNIGLGNAMWCSSCLANYLYDGSLGPGTVDRNGNETQDLRHWGSSYYIVGIV